MTYEIEIKSFLGTKEQADRFRKKLLVRGNYLGKNKQLNHYFEKGNLFELYEKIQTILKKESREKLLKIMQNAQSYSLRSREINGRVLLVLKVTIGKSSSANGISRIEFEEEIPLSLQKLDEIIVDSKFIIQAKWSREREEYTIANKLVTIDKNAGYGYLAEIEEILQDQNELERVKKEIYALMKELDLKELPQDRLERMFAYYNANWEKYYGTENTFVIE